MILILFSPGLSVFFLLLFQWCKFRVSLTISLSFSFICLCDCLLETKHPAGNYMFKVNNRNTRREVGVVLVSLLLTLNIFHTFVLKFLLFTLSR